MTKETTNENTSIVKAEVTTITPELAAKMLLGNVRNRPMPSNSPRVKIIADAIRRGEWELNGEAIIMNGSRLLDGQFRLAACVMANMPIQALVVHGVRDEAFHTIDSGTSRSAHDVLSLSGIPNARHVVSALKWVYRYKTGRTQSKVILTTPQIEELLELYRGVASSTSQCRHIRVVAPSILAAAHYLFGEIDKESADRFVTQLNSGLDLNLGDGVYVLRERLLADKLSKGHLTETYRFALIIRAWNARRAGAAVRSLKWVESGPTQQAFPVIK